LYRVRQRSFPFYRHQDLRQPYTYKKYRKENDNMKKIIPLILGLAAIVALCAFLLKGGESA